MMTKTNTSKNRIFRLLFVIPAVAIALTLNLKCTSEGEDMLNNEEVVLRDADGKILEQSIFEEVDNKTEEVFVICEEMPEYPDGEYALQRFIAKNIKYPKVAQQNGIEGRVYITFVVNQDGIVKNTKVIKGVDPSLDAEALRVVSSMPDWKPGKQDGKAVSVSYTVPINFALN